MAFYSDEREKVMVAPNSVLVYFITKVSLKATHINFIDVWVKMSHLKTIKLDLQFDLSC